MANEPVMPANGTIGAKPEAGSGNSGNSAHTQGKRGNGAQHLKQQKK